MALYKGWNREEMKQIGAAALKPSTTNVNHISSFTPINYNHAQPQFISPSRTLMSKALDSDALYNLPAEVVPEITPSQGRKRGAIEGRAVSLGAVWEYNDDEDLQGGRVDTPAPKKRKAALKRSKSTKGPSKTLSEIWDITNDAQQDNEQQNSQLTTPPDSGKKSKKRMASSISQSKGKRPKPFKDPTITKPSAVREKEPNDSLSSSKPISTHPCWTTTEDALKSNANGLAKTTLDKLAAFRYKPSVEPFCPETPTHLLVQGVGRPELAQERTLQPELPEVGHSSSNYGSIPSLGSLLGGPLFKHPTMQVDEWSQEPEAQTIQLPDNETMLDHSNNNFFTEALWNVRSSSQVASSTFQNLVDREGYEPQPDSSTHPDPTPSQAAPAPENFPPDSSVPRESAHTDIFDPTSSEARVLGCLPDYVGDDGHIQQVSESFDGNIMPTKNRTSIAYLFSEDAIENEHDFDASGFEAEEEAAAFESFPTVYENLGQPRPSSHSSEHLQMRGHVTELQVERSDVDDIETTSKNVSKDYDSDEFDEGLDDNDLLGVLSDAIVPDTQLNLKSNAGERHQRPQSQPPDSVSAREAFLFPNLVQLAPKTNNPKQVIENDQTSQHVLTSQPEDDYPMDAEDEEMFRMPNLITTGVIEKFQAPASLHYAFGDNLGPREVYDSSLQFSPPKARHTVTSPQKVHTDKTSTAGSPTRRSETEPMQLEEGEDWSFLRPNTADNVQAQVAPASSVPMQDIVEGAENFECLSSQARSHPPDSAYPSVSTTQRDTMWVLDDSHEYKPLQPFARPEFPTLIRDRSPITGVSAQTFLRVCFRIGEMFREGARCEALKQDAVIELFARVTFSSREPGTTKQHFQFADLWHDRPPFPNGILINYKMSGLVESESKAFLGADEGTLARCLGRLKRDSKSATGWMLHILNIRLTDWEEIRWTKRIVSAGLVKSEILTSKL
ncbi:hypothetical protein V8E51_002172 [Hyaloscypha variabilis]